jgi:tryptophan synthase beta chain
MQIKIHLEENEMPDKWYNIVADMPTAVPPPKNEDGSGINPGIFLKLLPLDLVEQEISAKRWIPIPEQVREMYWRWRPTPLRRAVFLEKALNTPAKIFYKDESVSPAGSHKLNAAIPQVWYNKMAGTRQLITETGAGQWGSAMCFACVTMDIKCKIIMVRVSYEQKPFRRVLMNIWGGDCTPSPTSQTNAGRDALKKDPNCPGSLGIGMSEVIEMVLADKTGKTKYAVGSALNHILLHQTIIGLEAKKQLLKVGIKKPDVVIGCVGGGSNFGGIAFPFACDKIHGEQIDIIPVEPAACPKMTKGIYGYDYADSARLMPLLAMHSLGSDFVPPPIHAGGLRFHGVSPLISQGINNNLLSPRSIQQSECFKAAILWARTEGYVPAPESSHAIAAAIQEAVKAREEGKEKVILFNLSGHGLLDLSSYEKYLSGGIEDCDYSESQIREIRDALAFYPRVRVYKNNKVKNLITASVFKVFKLAKQTSDRIRAQ